MSKIAQNLSQRIFGKLTVVRRVNGARVPWLCRCACGKKHIVSSSNLLNGTTKSCGCLAHIPHPKQVESATIHGHHKGGKASITANSYDAAKQRCTNSNRPNYYQYGGRGIEFRFKSFEHSLTILGERPSSKHSIDRIDPNGHYEEGNVRWATNSLQQRNKRSRNEFVKL